MGPSVRCTTTSSVHRVGRHFMLARTWRTYDKRIEVASTQNAADLPLARREPCRSFIPAPSGHDLGSDNFDV